MRTGTCEKTHLLSKKEEKNARQVVLFHIVAVTLWITVITEPASTVPAIVKKFLW